jgi:hypothetical protein
VPYIALTIQLIADQDYPYLEILRIMLNVLAAMVTGIIMGKNCQLPTIVRQMPVSGPPRKLGETVRFGCDLQ